MIRNVVKKQYSLNGCFGCGIKNESGLQCEYFELDDGTLAAICTLKNIHKSYPDWAHGGIISTLLDEAICRTIQILEPNTWGVTSELNIKFKKPVPVGERLVIAGHVTENRERVFFADSAIFLPDGSCAAICSGVAVKNHQSTEHLEEQGETVVTHPKPDDPKTFDIPEY